MSALAGGQDLPGIRFEIIDDSDEPTVRGPRTYLSLARVNCATHTARDVAGV